MRNCFTLFFVLVPLAAGAVVGTTSHVALATAANAWSGVGQMGGGSAVAIGPHAVLTAGHVAADDFELGGVTYHMTSTTMAPAVNKSATDLRVVFISETLPSWYTVGSSIKTGATVTMVGFGESGVVNGLGTGYTIEPSDTDHAANNKISSKGTTAGRGPTMLTLLKSAGDGVLASGDSGGGWFSGGKLVGISDFTFNNKPLLPDYGFNKKKPYFGSGAIDLTNKTLQAWLKSGMHASTAKASVAKGARVAPVPEPGTFAALALGAGALLRRRKR